VETNALYFGAKNKSAISETYENNTRMRVTHQFEVHHQECTKRLIIGIIQTVTESYESHSLLADLKRKNGIVTHTAFYPSASFLFFHS